MEKINSKKTKEESKISSLAPKTTKAVIPKKVVSS